MHFYSNKKSVINFFQTAILGATWNQSSHRFFDRNAEPIKLVVSRYQVRSNISQCDVDRPAQAPDAIRATCANKPNPKDAAFVPRRGSQTELRLAVGVRDRWELSRAAVEVWEAADRPYDCTGWGVSTGGLTPRTYLAQKSSGDHRPNRNLRWLKPFYKFLCQVRKESCSQSQRVDQPSSTSPLQMQFMREICYTSKKIKKN